MRGESATAPHVAARTAAATVLVMAGAALAHAWAGGELPGAPQLLALTGLVFGAGTLTLRWRVPLLLLAPFVLLAQAGLHVLFGPLAAETSHAGHVGITSAAEPLTWRMVLAHLVSTLFAVLVWWLSQRTATLLVRVLELWTTYAGGRRDAALRVPSDAKRQARLVCLVGAPRRGPPMRFA